MVLAQLVIMVRASVRASVRSEGIAVEEPQNWCPICNIPDTNKAPCRCDYPTVDELVELLRKIYTDAETSKKVKALIEEAFR